MERIDLDSAGGPPDAVNLAVVLHQVRLVVVACRRAEFGHAEMLAAVG
jgi:hypothetical protein